LGSAIKLFYKFRECNANKVIRLWSALEEAYRSPNKGWEEVIEALMSLEDDQRTLAQAAKDQATPIKYVTLKLAVYGTENKTSF
jgi:hypothetical protein